MTGAAAVSEREEERKYEYHDDTHDDLEGQADLDVVHEGILTGRHYESVGRSGERGGKAHAGRHGHSEEQRPMSTAVTVLLINIVSSEVVKYTPAITARGP